MASTAYARKWFANPKQRALDYSYIEDRRSPHEVVVLFWLVPEIVPDSREMDFARKTFEEYLIFGATHISVDDEGRITRKTTNVPIVHTINGQLLNRLGQEAISPLAARMVEVFKQMARDKMGLAGQSMEWFVFDGQSVSSCGEGGFRITFAGTDYDYRTPIPGC